MIDLARGVPDGMTTWANSNYFVGVSCVAKATCGIVGNAYFGTVFAWHGRVPA